MNGRRSKTHVLVDILKVVRDNGKARPTHILYKANLSHKLMKQHLEMLMANEFIEQKDEHGKVYYKITKRGLTFIEEFKKIEKFSQAFGLPL
jgi:predicted transcriptional regulator